MYVQHAGLSALLIFDAPLKFEPRTCTHSERPEGSFTCSILSAHANG